MQRYFYAATVSGFCDASEAEILGQLAVNNAFDLETTQRDAWVQQIHILKQTLTTLGRHPGHIYFEYTIPRVGKRVDCILLMDGVIFVIEFKVGESKFDSHDVDQVWDYALDLKNFHETSHHRVITPILVATEAPNARTEFTPSLAEDQVVHPLYCNSETLAAAIQAVATFRPVADSDLSDWQHGRYLPTPTIIEAAMALYRGHSVEDISRRDAEAANLTVTGYHRLLCNRCGNSRQRFLREWTANSPSAACRRTAPIASTRGDPLAVSRPPAPARSSVTNGSYPAFRGFPSSSKSNVFSPA
ncbi:hypothetical protein Pan44_54760 [Caulifigura coniformis]|uniref:Uncharacterized protein n=1 Tax=Caulifigura coniformis TaxID=2527983 RepID=A0A517SMQ8_9PLAN|nr:hypothetical protein [Caulifigura coniformis]QDT57407.1 hypothetical protein Pan44_54760 [Caulifigura coniformis]